MSKAVQESINQLAEGMKAMVESLDNFGNSVDFFESSDKGFVENFLKINQSGLSPKEKHEKRCAEYAKRWKRY